MSNENRNLKHTKGGPTTYDETDVGVPMRPAAETDKPWSGPEDALDPNTRGDYSERFGDQNSYQITRNGVISQNELTPSRKEDE